MDLSNWLTVVIVIVVHIVSLAILITKHGKDIERTDKELAVTVKRFDQEVGEMQRTVEKLREERKDDFKQINIKLDLQTRDLTEIRVSMARIETRNENHNGK